MPKLLLFLLITFFSSSLLAADLRFSHLGIQQGGIDALTQDNHGFLWIGTRNGLLRYDGNTITTYRNTPGKPDTLQEDAIIALHYGKDGRLWIGTAENGASYYDYTTGKFTRIDISTTSKYAYRFYDDNPGKGIYVQTTEGLFFIDRNNQAKRVLSAKYSESVLGIHTNESGTHAILETGQKLTLGENPDRPEIYRIIPKKLIQYWQPEFCPHLIREPIQTGGGSGLFYCLQNGKVTDAKLNQTLFQAGINPAQLQVYDLAEDKNGIIWISSNLGLLRITGDIITTIKSNAFDGQSLSGKKLSVLLVGQKNTLFIGTQDQGLNILNLNNSGISYFDTLHTVQPTRTETTAIQSPEPCQTTKETEQPAIWATLKDADGDLWIGNNNGLTYRAAGSGVFQKKNLLSNKNDFIGLCTVWALAEANGKIWIGTDSGLIAYDKHRHTFTQYQFQQKTPDVSALTGNHIRVLLHDSKRNSLWVGTDQSGLNQIYLNNGKVQHFPLSDNNPAALPNVQVNSLYLDSNNRLWIGTNSGLSLWNEDSNTFRSIRASDNPATLSHASVHAIHQSNGNQLWLGTGNGLNLFNISQFKVEKRLFERDGLPNAVIRGLVPDNYGHYWLTTDNGLSRFDPTNSSFSNYYPQHDTQSGNASTTTWYKDKQDLIYLSGIDGLSVINPQAFIDSSKSYPPIITRVDKLDSQNSYTGFAEMWSSTGDQVLRKLTRNIRLNFTYPFFGDSNLLKSQYRLIPATDTWSETSPGSHYVNYTHLKPGTYEFQLRTKLAKNQTTSFRFDIKPYFWETSWFRVLALIMLLIFTVFLSIYAYRVWSKFSAEKMTQHHYRIVEHELRPHLHEANKQLQSLMQSPQISIKDKQTIRFSIMPMITKSMDFIAELRTLVDLKRTAKQPRQLYLLEDVVDEAILFFKDYQQQIVIREIEDLDIETHQDAVYLLVKNLGRASQWLKELSVDVFSNDLVMDFF